LTKTTGPPAPAPSTLDAETRAALGWLLNNQAHYPTDLVIPFAAAILRRPATDQLADLISQLDTLLDVRERARLHPDISPDRAVTDQDIEDVLRSLHELPTSAGPGDLVVYCGGRDDGDWVARRTAPGLLQLVDSDRVAVLPLDAGPGDYWGAYLGSVRLVQRAVYVPVPSDVDGAR
jgi:hypothetical protein